jgi:hypothetical protein
MATTIILKARGVFANSGDLFVTVLNHAWTMGLLTETVGILMQMSDHEGVFFYQIRWMTIGRHIIDLIHPNPLQN